ncbi:chorismate mutase [Trifolium repens]|nr:chorismate mutase [Trifolium repens]
MREETPKVESKTERRGELIHINIGGSQIRRTSSSSSAVQASFNFKLHSSSSSDKKWLLELLTYETVEASVQKRVEMKAKGHIVKCFLHNLDMVQVWLVVEKHMAWEKQAKLSKSFRIVE